MHESGENFGVTTGRFSEIWKRRGMKVNAGKSSVVKRWKRKYDWYVSSLLEHVSKFKYLVFMNQVQMELTDCTKEANERKVEKVDQIDCEYEGVRLKFARVLHESLLVPDLVRQWCEGRKYLEPATESIEHSVRMYA